MQKQKTTWVGTLPKRGSVVTSEKKQQRRTKSKIARKSRKKNR